MDFCGVNWDSFCCKIKINVNTSVFKKRASPIEQKNKLFEKSKKNLF